METSSPPPKWGTAPQFSANVYCDQTAGWIKMPLGREVYFRPGHIVIDGDPFPQKKKKRGTALQFSAHVCCGQTAGWIKMPFGAKVGLGPGQIGLHGDRAHPHQRGIAPNFGSCLLRTNGRPPQLLLSTCLQPLATHIASLDRYGRV